MSKVWNRRHHPTPLVSRPIPSTTPAQMISATAKRPTYTRKRTNEPTERLSKRVVRLLGRRTEGRILLQSIPSSGLAKTTACACIGGVRASRLAIDHALHIVSLRILYKQRGGNFFLLFHSYEQDYQQLGTSVKCVFFSSWLPKGINQLSAKTNEGSQARLTKPYLVLRDVVTYSRNPAIPLTSQLQLHLPRMSKDLRSQCLKFRTLLVSHFLIFVTVLSTRGQ